MFDNADKHPTAYELFVLPLAAYDSDGKLVKVDKKNERLRLMVGSRIMDNAV